MQKKVGILTFHYATNYGAVLQCYALQTYLKDKGYDVEVINYKPKKTDDNLYNFFRFRKFKNLSLYLLTRKRERALRIFRAEKLAMSSTTLRTMVEVQQYVKNFDILIAGSDQVLNPSTLLYSEAYGGAGAPCPIYFLGFHFSGKKIGYALSFGVTQYPEPQLTLARSHIHSFDKLSVRENTGIDIVKQMGRTDAIVVPDPTLLQKPAFYQKLASNINFIHCSPYIFSFFLCDIKYNQTKLTKLLLDKRVLWNNNDGENSIESWLHKIKHADFVITDSYHCMVMCLKLHTPFAVITKLEGKIGMNDRLYTILERIGMENRIIYRENMNQLVSLIESNISIMWDRIDAKLQEYAQKGILFLNDL